MSRDQQRYRKNYSYYRPLPREGTITFAVDESLDWKNSVRTASTVNHSLTGAGTSLSMGGVTIVDEDRVLLKNQSTPSQNGIYYFEVAGDNYTLARASDAAQGTLSTGATTYVEEGTNGGKIYILSTTGAITVDSTPLTWTEFSSGGVGGEGNDYWVSTTVGAIYTTGSVAIRGGLGSVDAAADIGTDVFLFVSGSIKGSGTNDKKAVFGGDVRVSGSLTFGSGSQSFTLKSLMPAGGPGRNIFIGSEEAGSSLVWTVSQQGSHNIAMGSLAGRYLTTGNNNVLVGEGSCGQALNSGYSNVALGSDALAAADNSWGNTAIGFSAARETRGVGNVSVGLNALLCIVTKTGNLNVAVGSSALKDGPGGDGNVGLGASALENLSNASAKDNVSVGYNAGKYYGIGSPLTNTSGSIFIGAGAAAGGDSQYNQIVIGSGSRGLGSNTTVIGNGLTTLTSIPSGSVGIGTTSVANIGTDVFLFVSGSRGSLRTSTKGVAAFGGDVVMSGSLEVSGDQVEITGSLSVTNGISGSLTKLTDGTSYLIAGPNITINTGSNGAVQITGSAGGPTGSGTDGFLTQWTGTSTIGNSFIKDMTPNGLSTHARYYKDYHQFRGNSDSGTYVEINSNGSTGGRIGIDVTPECPLHITQTSLPVAILEFSRFRNTNSGEGSGVRLNYAAGNFSNPTFRITHVWPSNVQGHYTYFGIAKPTPSGTTTPEIVERVRLFSSGTIDLSGSVSIRQDSEIALDKSVFDVQKSNGNQLLWISSSSGTNSVGSDVFMWVSGSRSDNNTGADKVVFGGDVRVSGSLTIGTGSVFLTSNDIQFGSSGIRIQKNGNDMKFFDLNNTGGKTLTELAAAGEGLGGSGTANYVAKFTGTSTLGVSTIFDNGTNVGIGSTNPDRLLVISGSGASLGIYNSATSAGSMSIDAPVAGGYAQIDVQGSFDLRLNTNNAEAMRINASQNVGIGTNTMTARVNVLGSNGNIGMIVQGGTTAPATNKPIFQVKGYDGGVVLHVSGSSTHGARVGIGTTNPRAICRLDVGSKGSTTTDNYVAVNAANTGECGFSWSYDGDQIWKFQRAAGTSNLSLVESGGTTALLCEYSSGNVGINTDNPSEKLHVEAGSIKVDTAGYGVRLPVSPTNADAQTLDCYEERTLSVTFDSADGAGQILINSSYDELLMTRVGRKIHISGHLRIADMGTAGGDMWINLGTASDERPAVNTPGTVIVDNAFGIEGLQFPIAIAASAESRIYLRRYTGSSGLITGDLANYLLSNTDIYISVTYTVAV